MEIEMTKNTAFRINLTTKTFKKIFVHSLLLFKMSNVNTGPPDSKKIQSLMFLIDLLAVLNKARSLHRVFTISRSSLSAALNRGANKINSGLISKQFTHANFHKKNSELFYIPCQRNSVCLYLFLLCMMRKCFSLL